MDEGNAKLGYLKISFKSLEDNSKLLSPQTHPKEISHSPSKNKNPGLTGI